MGCHPSTQVAHPSHFVALRGQGGRVAGRGTGSHANGSLAPPHGTRTVAEDARCSLLLALLALLRLQLCRRIELRLVRVWLWATEPPQRPSAVGATAATAAAGRAAAATATVVRAAAAMKAAARAAAATAEAGSVEAATVEAAGRRQ